MTRTLDVSGLVINRAGLPVVRGVSLSAQKGQISVLLGANGAGKTTLLEGLSGIIPTSSGDIVLNGRSVTAVRAGERARAGLSHVEQGRTVFRQLSTEENLLVGMAPGADIAEAYDLFPELLTRRGVRAGLLSGGEQQMLVIARSLLTRPEVILIDEMSAGLAPVVVQRLMAAVRRLADAGLAILLVEQFAALALRIADHAYVMRRGELAYDGLPQPLLADPDRLHHLYLGDVQTA
ncbi:MAG: ABC transporter ATP-binding protein [Pannonibacter sp.]